VSRPFIDEQALRDMIREIVRQVLTDEVDAKRPAEFLSTAEAADLARVAQGTVRRWIRERRLVGHRAGRELRVKRADLECLLGGEESSNSLSPETMADRDFRRR
jgi:excisionase family DNA binding protein